MTTSITRPQADALATLVHQLRPEWGIPGIIAALHAARDRGDAYAVSIAALHAASDLVNRTPAVIALPGAHWTKGKALGENDPIRFDRCPLIGHTSFPAHNCSACRSERLERTTQEAALAAQHVPPERIRQILAQTTQTTTERNHP